MRAALIGDVVATARALLAVPEVARPAFLHGLLDEADTAWRHRRATGRAHPLFGDGSLMTAALRRRVVCEPALGEADYCRCLATVLLKLAERHDVPDGSDRASALSS